MLKSVIFVALIAAISAATVCGPVCEIYCPYGNVLDENKCPTCKCNEAPISALKPNGEGCSPVLCLIYCVNGWKKNEEGCDMCACADQPQ